MVGSFGLLGVRGGFVAMVLTLTIFVIMDDESVDFTVNCLAFLFPFFTMNAVDCSRFSGNGTFLFSLPVDHGNCTLRGCYFAFVLNNVTLLLKIIVTIYCNVFASVNGTLSLICTTLATFNTMTMFVSMVLPIRLGCNNRGNEVIVLTVDNNATTINFLYCGFLPLSGVFNFFRVVVASCL